MRIARLFLMALIGLNLLVAGAATLAGLLAPWWPWLEMANHFRPFLLLITAALLTAAISLRFRPLIGPAAVLALVTAALSGAPLVHAAASQPPNPPFLRVVTFNVNWQNQRFNEIVAFLRRADADVVVLQEVNCRHAAQLIGPLQPLYPHVFGAPRQCVGQAILSKRPWKAAGRLGDHLGNTLMLWARFERDGTAFELGGLHLAFPFWPDRQARHVDLLISEFARRPGPRIVAGDFNLTPFSWKLAKLAYASGLRRHGTFLASWPTDWVMPAFLIDNVLSTREFATAGVRLGPDLGSDHRPVIADLALARP